MRKEHKDLTSDSEKQGLTCYGLGEAFANIRDSYTIVVSSSKTTIIKNPLS